MNIIIALLVFSLIIMVHEGGHFLMAKSAGIRVNEFSIGMGPRILKKQIGETLYSIKILPFGGSCMMEGEDEASENPRAFNKKTVWQRILVVAGGPVFNFILAFVGAMIIIGCEGYDEPIVYRVTEGFPAQEAGMQAGDRIVKLGNMPIHVYREVSMYVQMHQGETTKVVYERDGQKYTVTLEPKLHENGMRYLGFSGIGVRTKGNVFKTIGYSAYEVKFWIESTLQSLKMLFRGRVKATEVSGAVGIVSTMGEVYEESRVDGWYYVMLNMVNFLVLLSANLGVMNLLPIPALDGGRLVFLIIEALRGKPIDPEKEGMVHFAGFVLLMILMVVVLANDILKLM